MKVICLGGKKGRCGADVDPHVKAQREALATLPQSASKCSTKVKTGCEITMFTNKTPKAFGLICLQCLCALPFAVFRSCTRREICLEPCMAAGRKGHLEGLSISHVAPHTSPGGPGVGEKDPKKGVAWISLRRASAARIRHLNATLHKEKLMRRNVPEGWLAEGEGYCHWARRQPHMETIVQVIHRGAGCTAKLLCSSVTTCHTEESHHLSRLTRGSAWSLRAWAKTTTGHSWARASRSCRQQQRHTWTLLPPTSFLCVLGQSWHVIFWLRRQKYFIFFLFILLLQKNRAWL